MTILLQLRDWPRAGIAKAQEVATDGRVVQRSVPIAVRLPPGCIPLAKPGTLWSVEGPSAIRTIEHQGLRFQQEVIQACAARLQRPDGQLLARWIAANVPGIGEVIARRLVRTVPDLDEQVRTRNLEALCAVAGLSEQRARALLDHWPEQGLYDVIAWLQQADLPPGIGERLCRLHGARAAEILRRDPFSLLGFGIPIAKLLRLAKALGMRATDEVVLSGLAEYAAAVLTARTGATMFSGAQLAKEIERTRSGLCPSGASAAPECARRSGALLAVPGGYQALGHALMERTVAHFVGHAARREPGTGALLAAWEATVSRRAIRDALAECEQTFPFDLTDEQRWITEQVVRSPVAVVTGEAGTGKTTILRAILGVYEAIAGIPLVQVALSGRAARRMAEATGKPAHTIAKFVAEHAGAARSDVPPHVLVVVDEASMVDLLSAYRLVRILPEATRIVFVGDVAQLPPVGPGSVFHALAATRLPVFRLSIAQRQRTGSDLHRFARALRGGEVPALPPVGGTCDGPAAVSHTPDMRPEHVARLWTDAGGADRAIILSPTRKGAGGVDAINRHLQQVMGRDRPKVHYADPVRGWIPWVNAEGLAFHLHDRVMVTANDYKADIRNGDLGTIVEVFEEPAGDGSGGRLIVEGREIALNEDVLGSLSLGYAVTVHKSQGSQWPVCLLMLPGHASHMADRTLFYTAATRATEQLILCGDRSLLVRAVGREARASARKSNLTHLLRKEMVRDWCRG